MLGADDLAHVPQIETPRLVRSNNQVSLQSHDTGLPIRESVFNLVRRDRMHFLNVCNLLLSRMTCLSLEL